MKLLSIKIDNYKSLKNVEIENLSKINLLYGYNNSGKSNILNFIEILFREKTEEIEEEYEENGVSKTRRRIIARTSFYDGFIYNMPYSFHKNDKSTPIEYSIKLMANKDEISNLDITKLIGSSIIDDKDQYIIHLEGKVISIGNEDLRFILVKANIEEVILAQRDGRNLSFFPDVEATNFDLAEVGSNILDSFNNSVLFLDSDRYFQKEFSNLDLSKISSKNFKNWLFDQFMDHKTNSNFEGIVSFLKEFKLDITNERYGSNLVDSSINLPFNEQSKIGFTRFDDELEVMLENGLLRLPLKNYGTGIQQILYILSRIYQTKANIVIVEEFELNLSPLFQFELVSFIKTRMGKELNQLIFTSHNPNFNNEPELIDNHRYKVKMNNEGITEISELPATIHNLSIHNIYE